MNVPERHRALVAGALSVLCLTAICSRSSDLHAETAVLTGKEIVVTPFRTEMEISRSGSAITIIRADEIQKWGAQTLADVMRSVPGVSITQNGGPAGLATLRLRGAEARHSMVMIDGIRIEGSMRLDGAEVYGAGVDVIALRKRMGMVFQKPNPFPMSIYENVVYPLRVDGIRDRALLDGTAERALKGAALWEEAKDRLKESALGLSGGQQQRLCIARAIAADPDVLLMDEPCSALDPIATSRIEELIDALKGRYTIVIVTHNMQQAARVSDNTAFMYLGRLIKYGETEAMFTNPKLERTQSYITGRFG